MIHTQEFSYPQQIFGMDFRLSTSQWHCQIPGILEMPGILIRDPAQNYALVFACRGYEDAQNWLLEDEY
ncbi:hypothetical protein [Baaleninema sp.]|uniref:hypothetical protein n=1 Tax=Baaleninema sp. TaxID=3101197 RepID=UPI003D038E13